MFHLAHISDVHLGPMSAVRWRDLLSKRVTGYLNWQKNRAKHFSPKILNHLTAHMIASTPDHVLITGDLVNLALPFEIKRAKSWLNALGNGHDISITCGNHDAYVKGALEAVIKQWQENLIGDDQVEIINNTSFPVLRKRGPCALILVNSALPTRPFNATGLFDQQQAEKLEKLLDLSRDSCRIIAIHHPPFPGATKPTHSLIGEALFREVVAKTGAELILHGHTHRDTYIEIDGPGAPLPVISVPAGGQALGGKKPAAHYNWFQIKSNAKSGSWSITRTKIGYGPTHHGIAPLQEPDIIST